MLHATDDILLIDAHAGAGLRPSGLFPTQNPALIHTHIHIPASAHTPNTRRAQQGTCGRASRSLARLPCYRHTVLCEHPRPRATPSSALHVGGLHPCPSLPSSLPSRPRPRPTATFGTWALSMSIDLSIIGWSSYLCIGRVCVVYGPYLLDGGEIPLHHLTTSRHHLASPPRFTTSLHNWLDH